MAYMYIDKNNQCRWCAHYSATSYGFGQQHDGCLISPVHTSFKSTNSYQSATAYPSNASSSRFDPEAGEPHSVSRRRMPAAHVHPTIHITKPPRPVNHSSEVASSVPLANSATLSTIFSPAPSCHSSLRQLVYTTIRAGSSHDHHIHFRRSPDGYC